SARLTARHQEEVVCEESDTEGAPIQQPRANLPERQRDRPANAIAGRLLRLSNGRGRRRQRETAERQRRFDQPRTLEAIAFDVPPSRIKSDDQEQQIPRPYPNQPPDESGGGDSRVRRQEAASVEESPVASSHNSSSVPSGSTT